MKEIKFNKLTPELEEEIERTGWYFLIDYSEIEKANKEKVNAWLEKKNSEVK